MNLEGHVKERYGDLLAGSFIFLFSIALFAGAQNVKTLAVSRIGSGFFPSIVAVLMAIVSIPIIAGGIKTAKAGSKNKEAGDEAKENKPKLMAVLATFALMLGYAAALPPLGFPISTAVYLFLQMLILSAGQRRRFILFAAVSAASSVAIYYLFVLVFHLMLPAGILG